MSSVDVPLKEVGFGKTARKDSWWIQPLVVFLGLSAFIVYTTWAALQGNYYAHGPYLSPLYSPEIFADSPHNWFGPKPGWWAHLGSARRSDPGAGNDLLKALLRGSASRRPAARRQLICDEAGLSRNQHNGPRPTGEQEKDTEQGRGVETLERERL